MKNKFDLYDIVIVCSQRKDLEEINGCRGYISGMAQDEETGLWGYAVGIYDDKGYAWYAMEEELLPTGEKEDPRIDEPVDTVRVRVDPETGEGYLVDEEEE
jgi:hypothetical protein